jgi:hypothetical protein
MALTSLFKADGTIKVRCYPAGDSRVGETDTMIRYLAVARSGTMTRYKDGESLGEWKSSTPAFRLGGWGVTLDQNWVAKRYTET